MSEDERTAMLAPPPATGPTRRINGRRVPPPVVAGGYEDYYDDEPPRRTARTVGIVAAVLVALGLIGFVAYQLLSGSAAPKQVQVPTVTGLALQDAQNRLIDAKLSVGKIDPVDSTLDQKGKVQSTDPPGGTQLPERSVVNLAVGNGPPAAPVPALVGMTTDQAKTALADRGLTLGAVTEQETSNPDQVGKILDSTPKPGADAPGGSAVAVVVGTKPTTVAVPPVSGQDSTTAQQTLKDAGFQVQVSQVDGGGDAGSVLGTSPAAGTQAAKGSTVTLQLSKGNQASQVPDVTGQSESDARKSLEDAGFTNIDIQDADIGSNTRFDGKVIDQNPRGGSTADPDQTITLTIGKASGNGGGNGGGLFGGGN